MRLEDATTFFDKGTPLSVVGPDNKEFLHLSGQITPIPEYLKYIPVERASIEFERRCIVLHTQTIPK